ncbi:MAG: bacterial Ig-like domain-containing protein [Ruminococcus sp.]|nr:bacterial Ig-like domain-containing protein [Candidatus Copronaster equi]
MKKIISILLSILAVFSLTFVSASAEEKTVTDIWVITRPVKTEYIYNEELDLTGLVLGVAYSDGTYAEVNSGYTCDTTVLKEKGAVLVTIDYMGEKENMQVQVNYSTKQKILSVVELVISFLLITVKNIVDWF